MENRDPIILSRFRDETSRVRDTEMERQYRLSLGLVVVLLIATVSTVVSVSTAQTKSSDVVVSRIVQAS